MDEGLETAARGIFERAKAIILTPKDEWQKIAGETTPQRDILMRYVLPLAAIGPVAAFIGGQVFGYGAFGFSYRPSLIGGLTTAIVSFVLSLVSLFVMTFIADFLAPKFAGEANRANAFKLVAYSYTAGWAVGIFSLIPMLGFFGLLGLYSVYLLYTGAMPLMKVPASAMLYQRALDIQSRWRFGIYDSLIVASAQAAGCTRLLTEDLQHRQRIETLLIENPFKR